MSDKYQLPSFLSGNVDHVDQADYTRWLRLKAQTHLKRDRKRGNKTATGEAYRDAIHSAVLACGGRDSYTDEELKWSLISKYNNDDSQKHGRHYKSGFAMLPTVDHVGDGTGPADFKICSWKTNDAKNDLDMPAFLALCQAVLVHNGYVVTKRG